MVLEQLTELDINFRVKTATSIIIPMPTEFLTTYAQGFVDGEVFDWKSNQKLPEGLTNPFTTFKEGLFRNAGSPESNAAMEIISNDLAQFEPSKDLIASDQFPEFWNRLMAGYQFWIKSKFWQLHKIPTGDAIENYVKLVEQKRDKLGEIVSGFDIEDLPIYYRFSDFMHNEPIFRNYSTIATTNQTNDPFLKEILTKSLEFGQRVGVAHRIAFHKMNVEWTWEQVSQTIEALGKMQNNTNMLEARLALTAKLKTDKTFSPARDIHYPEDFDFDQEGLMRLLMFQPTQETLKIANDTGHSPTVEYFEEQLTDNIPIPKKYIPLGIVSLYTIGKLSMPEETILAQLQNLVQATRRNKLSAEILATAIVFLYNFGGLTSNQSNTLLESLSNLPKNIRDILTDKIPGKIYLTLQRHLLGVDTQTNISQSKGFLIYTSSAQTTNKNESDDKYQNQTNYTHRIPENQLETEVNTYDFVGDIGIMEDEKVVEYLEKQKARYFPDADEINLKVWALQENFQMPNGEQTLIFHYPLNSQDEPMKEAKKLGIETIVISGNVVTFVLDKEGKDQPYSTNLDGKKIPTAFTATLDEDGWLTLDAQEEQNYLTLTLNMIVLELAAKKPQEEVALEQLQAQTKPTIDEWNRNTRGSLPRLNTNLSTETDVLIAVKTNGQTVFTSQS